MDEESDEQAEHHMQRLKSDARRNVGSVGRENLVLVREAALKRCEDSVRVDFLEADNIAATGRQRRNDAP